jgi:hypothetical protein
VDVEDFVPYQPLTEGVQYTRRSTTASGVNDEGAFIRFMFGILSETQYQAMLTQAGVYTADTALVTLYAQDENYEWTYINGTAVKPLNAGRKGFFLYNVPLLIREIFLAATVP